MVANEYYTNWENGYPYLSDQDYEDYKYRFDCRVAPLIDAAHVKLVGCKNPEHREFILWKLDRRYEEGRFPWQQRSNRAWDGQITSPEQWLQVVISCMKFVAERLQANPDYQPPEQFLTMMAQLDPIVQKAKALRERATVACPHNTEIEGSTASGAACRSDETRL